MEDHPKPRDFGEIIGMLPYRMALAGGWIDQPFISCLDPAPPGSMVVINLRPDFRFMDRCGMGTSTRMVAQKLWGSNLPDSDPMSLVKQLYEAENKSKQEPSGSQDMAGLIYPGINRLDYHFEHEGGIFPIHVESNNDPELAVWLENLMYVLPVNQRPPGYNPLGSKNLAPHWIRRLGQSGRDCYDSILRMDAQGLGESMNECMRCWEAILPNTVRHPYIDIDLIALLEYYQSRYFGAMYSGCGGGYLYIIADKPVPGAFQIKVRTKEELH
jgi:hypothetical protein